MLERTTDEAFGDEDFLEQMKELNQCHRCKSKHIQNRWQGKCVNCGYTSQLEDTVDQAVNT